MKEHTVPYTELNDIQLIRLLRQGEDPVMDYLLEKYKYLVRKRANALFLLGGDSEDLSNQSRAPEEAPGLPSWPSRRGF